MVAVNWYWNRLFFWGGWLVGLLRAKFKDGLLRNELQGSNRGAIFQQSDSPSVWNRGLVVIIEMLTCNATGIIKGTP